MPKERCKPVTEVHSTFRNVFQFDHFNKMQSECFETVYFSDVNMVIGAPTGLILFELFVLIILGSGKTGHTKIAHYSF